MSALDITPFKVSIPASELKLLKTKLETSRLPNQLADCQWGEANGVTLNFMRETVQFWINEYDWRQEEEKINQMPQFKTHIDGGEFGSFDVHFVHMTSNVKDAIPLLFLHGWPGSFIEVQKILTPLTAAGFHVVAPSLPGYGFSSYTNKAGFKFFHHADVMHKLMTKLGYQKYAVQGGDWGSIIARSMALRYPDSVKAIHMNMLIMQPPELTEQPAYSEFELASFARAQWFKDTQSAYQQMHSSRPRTLGFAMHDSPVGALAWMADKLLAWSDSYAWTPTEIITWTLLHYFPGPTAALQMYRENMPPELQIPPEQLQGNFVAAPTGVSAFAKELVMVPRSWAEKENNIAFWAEHPKGGHFAAYERPEELSTDVITFLKSNWKA
ncbi:hypothetical protein PV05_09224 [Neofusicoccum parvum]|uniref:Uncharacterized protein n=1 Tax=Neofusicoccum parvum TaxID=310453 RepID=A0ACB5SK35_9PEZI|nr:hypothetical protein PV05_09224 [Neofusicoccum parvum]